MIFHRVLDQVFSTWSHIAVLRVLQDAAQGLTGREIARLSSMSHRSCLNALTHLEDLHLLVRQRGGRDHLFVLNRDHVLVSEAILPLLQAERGFLGQLEESLKKHFRRRIVSVILFGSVVRREETVRSDLDVCLLVRTASEKEAVRERIHSLASSVQQRFGARLSPIIFTTLEFARGVKSKKSPMKEIAGEGRVIAGRSLREVMRG
jgi:predicted nucleotidyltransferase